MPCTSLQRVKILAKQAVFTPKASQFRVIARPQRGRGNLKVEGMASRTEARESVAKRNPYRKKHGNRCVVLLPLSSFQGFVSFRSTIFRFGMTNRIVKDCRVGRKMRPPRNDRIGRLDRKHGTQNPIFGFRKTSLICCLILTVPDFFDSLKRPRGSNESRGRCCLCRKLCAADFILESVKKLEELFIAPTARQILHETAQRACA